MNPEERARFMELVKGMVNSSPFYKHMGIEFTNYGDGTSTVFMKTEEGHKNLYGTLHGGSIASLIDSACGLAIGTKLEMNERAVTIELRTTYIAPSKSGTLKAEGKILHRGGHIAIAEAIISDEKGTIIARGGTVHFIQRGNGT